MIENKKMVKYSIRLFIVISLISVAHNGVSQYYKNIQPVLGSPNLKEVNTELEMPKPVNRNKQSDQGMTIEEISNIEVSPAIGFDAAFETKPKSVVIENEGSSYKWPVDLKIFLFISALAIVFIIFFLTKKKPENLDVGKSDNKKGIYEFGNLNQQLFTLEKLHDLKQKGAISEEEYIRLKNKLVE